MNKIVLVGLLFIMLFSCSCTTTSVDAITIMSNRITKLEEAEIKANNQKRISPAVCIQVLRLYVDTEGLPDETFRKVVRDTLAQVVDE